MSTSWTLTAAQVCADALEHLGVLAEGESASTNDTTLAMKALDIVLKELPLAGYTWPKVSAETALTWAAGAAISLPADYFGYPVAWKLLNGYRYPLVQIPHAEWIAKLDREETSTTLTSFYISPDKKFYGWPVVAADPTVTIQYQQITADASSGAQPDLPQYWLGALGIGVANELSLKYGLPRDKRMELAARWTAKRELALQNSVQSEPISFSVAD